MLQTLLLPTYPFLGSGPSVGWAFDTPNPLQSQGGGFSGAVPNGKRGFRMQRRALEKMRR
jgi:hypothetical protein